MVQYESRKLDQSCNNGNNINNDLSFFCRDICVNRKQSWSWTQFHPGTGSHSPLQLTTFSTGDKCSHSILFFTLRKQHGTENSMAYFSVYFSTAVLVEEELEKLPSWQLNELCLFPWKKHRGWNVLQKNNNKLIGMKGSGSSVAHPNKFPMFSDIGGPTYIAAVFFLTAFFTRPYKFWSCFGYSLHNRFTVLTLAIVHPAWPSGKFTRSPVQPLGV